MVKATAMVDKLYSDLNFPGSFSGVDNVRRLTKGKVSKKDFEKWKTSSRTRTLFAPRRFKFPRLKYV